MVVIAEGYATAATIAKQPNICALAAFDSGNLLAVATALREQHKGKVIVIAGDDDHRLENNPGRLVPMLFNAYSGFSPESIV